MDRRNLLLSIGAVIIGIGLYMFCCPMDFDPDEFMYFPPPPKLEGPTAPNGHLRNAKLLLKGQVSGPESLLVEGDTIYTGTWDAKLLKIVDGQIRQTIMLPAKGKQRPEQCGLPDTEPLCGRPLGIRRLDARRLIVADAYLGLFTVDFEDGKVQQIFSPDSAPGGRRTMFLNDLDVAKGGRTVFFSDSSSKWERRNFLYAILEQKPLGRLFRLDLTTGKGKADVLVDGLFFANGVQLHPDNQSVLVSECSMARIKRFFFTGPRKGQLEMFAENLPGYPDNIRLSRAGNTFLVGLASVRHADRLVNLLDWLGPYPTVRRLIVQFVPKGLLVAANLRLKPHGIVLELDMDGRVLRSWQDPEGQVVPDISQASDDGTHLYLGSFHSDFIAKVPKKAVNKK